MVMPQPDPWMYRPDEVIYAPYPSPEPPPEEDEEEETAGFWERWAKKWFQLEPGQTWWDKYSPLLGFTPPTGGGPVELVPGAIDFETIITSPVLTVEQKTDLVEGFHPDRLAEAIEILANPAYDIPSEATPTEEALAQFLISGGGDEEFAIPLPEGMPQQWTDAAGQIWYWDGSGEYKEIGFDPAQVYEPEPVEPTVYPSPEGEAPTDPYGRTATWDADNAQWRYPPDWGVDPATRRAGYVPPTTPPQWRPGELELQRQQMEQQAQQQAWQQEEAQRQYGAQLAAQPASYLQYAAYTGQQPAIQPWMLPLMPQQYQQLGAGQAIPGWQAPQAGQMDGFAQGMAGLPQLTRPSRQYQARMGPTALAQYGGYQQARTGARPEETSFRLWSAAPPSGQYQGLRYTR